MSYLISVVIGFAVVHIQAYTAGGVPHWNDLHVRHHDSFMLLGHKSRANGSRHLRWPVSSPILRHGVHVCDELRIVQQRSVVSYIKTR